MVGMGGDILCTRYVEREQRYKPHNARLEALRSVTIRYEIITGGMIALRALRNIHGSVMKGGA